jgi:hypothetical protein
MAKKIMNSLLKGVLNTAGKAVLNKTAAPPAAKKTTAAVKPAVNPMAAVTAVKTALANTGKAASIPAASSTPQNYEKIKFGPFEWLVLQRKGDVSLVITAGIIETAPYHTVREIPTWETSTLRNYLNGKFLEKFSPEEKARIVEVCNQNPGNPWYTKKAVSTSQSESDSIKSGDPVGGNPTNDKVFVLSIEEVCTLFGDSTARLKNKGFTQHGTNLKLDNPAAVPSKEIMSYLIIINDGNNKNRMAENLAGKDKVGWWLRSPGEESLSIALVRADGGVWVGGTPFKYSVGIRPALWLKI